MSSFPHLDFMELFQKPMHSILTRDENGMTPFHLAALETKSGYCVLNIMFHVSDAASTGFEGFTF